MGTKIICSVFLIVCSLLANATDISFVVYFAKGDVRKANKVKLKKGDKLTAAESFSLSDNASLVLVCSNYKVIQLNKKGTYHTKNMQGQCATNTAGYSSAYFKYVWEQFSHPHGKPEANPGDYMKNVGAVSRGCNAVSMAVSVDTIHYYAGELPLYWSSTYSQPSLALYDMPLDGAALQKKALVKNVPIQMQAFTKALLPGEYYWQLTDLEGNQCERNYLKLWDSTSYRLRVNELISTVPVSDAAETAFAKAFILQEHHFLAEAFQYYTLAAKLNARHPLYKKNLAQFYATPF